MAEEFDESEILFDSRSCVSIRPARAPERKIRRGAASSGPIPVSRKPVVHDNSAAEEEEDSGEETEEKLPPHVIVGRRAASSKSMAYSLFTGNGRTLKGRDLSVVRNSVLRMTGFLET
ncbi:hypothetical protein M569_07896 [Genlisea aurea]|uniref:Uncharacterized protein n=1 Tax=Genlisea aurea TaxID=192259 RepID=S8CJN6_9LAMI|nr:hypothetical protein M569_07896 [Genlisea aurea]